VRHKPLQGRQPPQGDGIEAGVGKELALGPYSCEGDKASPEPSKSAQSYYSLTPFRNLALLLFLSSWLGHYMAAQHDP
jgi:hypothetical protein